MRVSVSDLLQSIPLPITLREVNIQATVMLLTLADVPAFSFGAKGNCWITAVWLQIEHGEQGYSPGWPGSMRRLLYEIHSPGKTAACLSTESFLSSVGRKHAKQPVKSNAVQSLW